MHKAVEGSPAFEDCFGSRALNVLLKTVVLPLSFALSILALVLLITNIYHDADFLDCVDPFIQVTLLHISC